MGSLGAPELSSQPLPGSNKAFVGFQKHSSEIRCSTALTLLTTIREVHPDHQVTAAQAYRCDFIKYAEAGYAKAKLDAENDGFQFHRCYNVPTRRSKPDEGHLKDTIVFAKYGYQWREHSLMIYYAQWEASYATANMYYICTPRSAAGTSTTRSSVADELIAEVTTWCSRIHDEIYVFDSGRWTKSESLYRSVQEATWDEVILDPSMKKTLIQDIEGFFDREKVYGQFSVPWKVSHTVLAPRLAHSSDTDSRHIARDYLPWSSRQWEDYIDQVSYIDPGGLIPTALED